MISISSCLLLLFAALLEILETLLVLLLIGSAIMLSLGIIGYYIAKIYEEVKDRPRYILSDTCGEARHAEKDL